MQRVLREVRRDFFCDVTLHPKPGNFSAQTRYLHLLGRDLHCLVPAPGADQCSFASLANPVTQAGLGYPQDLGHNCDGLTGAHLAPRLQLELLRVLRTHRLGFHSLTPCRYLQQGLRTPLFRGNGRAAASAAYGKLSIESPRLLRMRIPLMADSDSIPIAWNTQLCGF